MADAARREEARLLEVQRVADELRVKQEQDAQILQQAQEAHEAEQQDEKTRRKNQVVQHQNARLGIKKNVDRLKVGFETCMGNLTGDAQGRKLNSIKALLSEQQGKMRDKSVEIQELLEPALLDQENEDCYNTDMDLEDFFQQISQAIQQFQQDHPKSSTRPLDMVVMQPPRDDDDKLSRLPQQEVPSFNGNYVNWVSFIDTFDALVGTNKRLNDTAKLGYLKIACKGDANLIIQKLQANGRGNYEHARAALKDRYENSRLIAKNHLALHRQCARCETRQWCQPEKIPRTLSRQYRRTPSSGS